MNTPLCLAQGQSPSPLSSSPDTASLSEEEANKKREEESKAAGVLERPRRRPPRGEGGEVDGLVSDWRHGSIHDSL